MLPSNAQAFVKAMAMFGTTCLCYVALCLVLSCICPREAQAAPSGPQQFKLANGLKVLILEDHSFPVVASMVWYRVGSRNETIGSTGITHLVEHLLFGNVGAFRKGEIGAIVARHGGQFNAFTSDDFTTFFEVLPPSKLELALRIEAERMRGAVFSENDVQAEVIRLQEEFEEAEKDSVDTLAREVRAAAFQQHPYHNPTTGWRNDVDSLTAQKARAYYNQYFRPDNATLVIVGDVKAQTALSLAKKYFEPVPKGETAVPPIQITEQTQRGERRVVVKHSGKQEVLHVAYHAPALEDVDAPAMFVLENVLSTSYAGRLKSKLVNARLCSSAQAAFEAKRDPGLFTITCYAGAGIGQEDLLDGLDGAVNQLRLQPVTDAELRRARNQAEFTYSSEGDGPYRAGFHLGFADSLIEWQRAVTWLERLRTVSAADVQRVAKRYLNPDARVIGWLSTPYASKPAAPRPSPGESSPPREQPKTPHSRQAMGVRMTGFKKDDYSPGPNANQQLRQTKSQLLPEISSKAPSQPLHQTASKAPSQPPGQTASKADSRLPDQTSSQPLSETSKKAPSEPLRPASSVAPSQPLMHSASQAISKATSAGPAGRSARTPASRIGTANSRADTGQQSAPPSLLRDTPLLPAIPKLESVAGAPSESRYKAIHERVLKNGLTLVVFETHLSPIVQIAGAIRAGDAYDPPGKKGLAWVVAQGFNHGSPRHNRTQLAQLQEDIGLPPQAMLKFEPGSESITFQTRCLSRDLSPQLGNLAEVLTTSGLAEADVERAKQDTIAAIKRAESSPSARIERAVFKSLISSNSPYAPGDPTDLAKSIANVKSADVKAFHQEFIVPGSTTIVLAGDVTLAQATQMVERALGNWSGMPRNARPLVQPNARRVMRTTIPTKDGTEGIVCLGQILRTGRHTQEFGQLLIADCVLASHPILGRLGQSCAAEPALQDKIGAESVQSSLQPIGDISIWSLSVRSPPDVVHKAVQTLLLETKKFTRSGVTQEELSEAKRYLIGATAVRGMSNLSVAAKSILESALQVGEPDFMPRLLNGISDATVESVNRVIRGHLKPDQATMVIAGGPQTIKTVREQVLSPPSKTGTARREPVLSPRSKTGTIGGIKR